MTTNDESPKNGTFNRWSALNYNIEFESRSTTFAETDLPSNPILLVDSISVEGLFGIFSIFFISTTSLILALILSALKVSSQDNSLQNNLITHYSPYLITIAVSAFLTGYAIILVLIIIFYLTRFSKYFRRLYQNHEKGFKITIFLAVIVGLYVFASLLATSDDTLTKISGLTGFALITVFLIFTQELFSELSRPYIQKLSNWMHVYIKSR